MNKIVNIKNVDEIYTYSLLCLEKVGVKVSLDDLKSSLAMYLKYINNENDIIEYLEEIYNIFIPEEEISLTIEDIYNHGFKYSKKRNLNVSYDEVVKILSPQSKYFLTESDIEDAIDVHFEDEYEFVPEEEEEYVFVPEKEDNSDWSLELEEEEEIDGIIKEEEEYFI